MVADSNSQIAWHRAQIKRHREALNQHETARFSFGEIAGTKAAGERLETAIELRRKIENSQRVIAAYERQVRRPMTTDFKTLTDAPWSNWNARGSSER